MDQFSRKFDIKNYNNALSIAKKMGTKAPKVHSWELLDGSFSFPRVRRYESVQAQMDQVEHFQDNLNTNLSNQVLVNNFITMGKQAAAAFNTKYSDGEFADPALTDPRAVAAAAAAAKWAN